jgi:hypothetical protein
VSAFVAQFDDYYPEMMRHLAFDKLKHWENSVRKLAAKALCVLCPFNPKFVCDEILIPLSKLCFDKVLNTRHGAVLGVSEILVGLSGNSNAIRKDHLDKVFRSLNESEKQIISDSENKKKFNDFYEGIHSKNHLSTISEEQMKEIKNIVDQVEKQRLYRGKGGEIMRAGVCNLISSMAQSEIKMNF